MRHYDLKGFPFPYATLVHADISALRYLFALKWLIGYYCDFQWLGTPWGTSWGTPGGPQALCWKTLRPNVSTLWLPIQKVAVCFFRGLVHHNAEAASCPCHHFKHTSISLKLFPPLLLLPLSEKKKEKSLLTVSYPPPLMPYLGYKCEEMTAL